MVEYILVLTERSSEVERTASGGEAGGSIPPAPIWM